MSSLLSFPPFTCAPTHSAPRRCPCTITGADASPPSSARGEAIRLPITSGSVPAAATPV